MNVMHIYRHVHNIFTEAVTNISPCMVTEAVTNIHVSPWLPRRSPIYMYHLGYRGGHQYISPWLPRQSPIYHLGYRGGHQYISPWLPRQSPIYITLVIPKHAVQYITFWLPRQSPWLPLWKPGELGTGLSVR